MFTVNRLSSGDHGAPPIGILDGTYVHHRVDCNGYDESGPPGLLQVVESWTPWTFLPNGQGFPLNRTDPTIPCTSEGQYVDRQETTGLGGAADPIIVTTTWTWKLTLEPEAAQ
jgi:hypothetical protein